jgi:hypothetical protein
LCGTFEFNDIDGIYREKGKNKSVRSVIPLTGRGYGGIDIHMLVGSFVLLAGILDIHNNFKIFITHNNFSTVRYSSMNQISAQLLGVQV